MAIINRRDFFKVPVGAGLMGAAMTQPAQALLRPMESRSFQLDNGLKVHVLEQEFGYTSILLALRSAEIMRRDGLAHIMEHTSFVGAAGHLKASEVEAAWKDHVQESNASTSPGEIVWSATFLPRHLPDVIELLALASLDQRFDEPTVAQEKAVVLQELYESKYSGQSQSRRQFDEILYGKNHPLVRDTLEAEIRKAREPADKLVAELRDNAERLRLPANMDLYILGSLGGHGARLEQLVVTHFGRYARKQAATLHIPELPRTSNYRRLTKRVRDLDGPLSELEIAWNTGVTIRHRDAAALTLLAEYTSTVLFERVREESGDSYAPQSGFETNAHAGIFSVFLTTTKDPRKVERRLLNILSNVKKHVSERELVRLRERLQLTRRRELRVDQALLDNMMRRNTDGLAPADLDIGAVSGEQVSAIAAQYLPGYRGAYVRLARMGSGPGT